MPPKVPNAIGKALSKKGMGENGVWAMPARMNKRQILTNQRITINFNIDDLSLQGILAKEDRHRYPQMILKT